MTWTKKCCLLADNYYGELRHCWLTKNVCICATAAAGLEGEDNVDGSNAGRGKVMGQGVVFNTWTFADGSAGGVGMTPVSLPSAEELADLGNGFYIFPSVYILIDKISIT